MLVRLAALTLLAAVVSSAQPKLVIEGGRTFDFGEIHTSSPVIRDLRITNGGTDTLRITDVSGTCGCTGILLSESDIPPGESAILKVTFDPSQFRGKTEKGISMKSNDPSDPAPRITFTADISMVIDFDVSHLTFSTLVDSAMTVDVAITNISERTFRITGVKSSTDELALRLSRDFLEPGGETLLHCTLTQKRAGILRGQITVTTDHPSLPSTDLTFFSFAKAAPDQHPGSSSR